MLGDGLIKEVGEIAARCEDKAVLDAAFIAAAVLCRPLPVNTICSGDHALCEI